MPIIDINCDVGEGVNNEALLMPYISSCNIACGSHAGDVATIDQVIALAQQYEVNIGAHPSFPDRKNFGRQIMNISLEALGQSLIQQIELLQERLRLLGGHLHHIKVHGALYNLSVVDKAIAKVIVKAVKKIAPEVILYVPYNSIIEQVAKEEALLIKYEVFADRNYNDDLRLVSRSNKNAVISDLAKVVKHISTMVLDQQVLTISNKLMPIKAETCCVHGDNEAAINIVKQIHRSLTQNGITIA